MPWRLVVICAVVGACGGGVIGFVRGLDYTPTLFFAIVEGAILFGVPALVLGLLLAACWSLAASLRRHFQQAP
jgi:ABC-type transport system involved in cytochrome c biogenesis permease subunit